MFASSNAQPVPIKKLIIAGITDIHLLNAESSSASTITYDLFGLGLMFVGFLQLVGPKTYVRDCMQWIAMHLSCEMKLPETTNRENVFRTRWDK